MVRSLSTRFSFLEVPRPQCESWSRACNVSHLPFQSPSFPSLSSNTFFVYYMIFPFAVGLRSVEPSAGPPQVLPFSSVPSDRKTHTFPPMTRFEPILSLLGCHRFLRSWTTALRYCLQHWTLEARSELFPFSCTHHKLTPPTSSLPPDALVL